MRGNSVSGFRQLGFVVIAFVLQDLILRNAYGQQVVVPEVGLEFNATPPRRTEKSRRVIRHPYDDARDDACAEASAFIHGGPLEKERPVTEFRRSRFVTLSGRRAPKYIGYRSCGKRGKKKFKPHDLPEFVRHY